MRIGGWEIGHHKRLMLIAGPCVVESIGLCEEIAGELADIAETYNMPVVFKASFDKANRTSAAGYRGQGIDYGLKALEHVRATTGLPVLTDVHDAGQVAEVASVVDVLQTPAFLCRQTDFIQAVAAAGKPVNLKKGQFLSPWEMQKVVEKARATGNQELMVTERGTTFGYNNLVVDMRSLQIMRQTGCPVIFDATHSVQAPGGNGASSGGNREYAPALARAAAAVGVAGIFLECHPDPDKALSDGPNSLHLAHVRRLVFQLVEIDRLINPWGQQG